MKYSSLLTVLAFLVVSAGSAFGQNGNDNADLTASASVLQDLEVNFVQNLLFGNVGLDETVTINGDGSSTTGGSGTQQEGRFEIVSAENAEIQLTFTGTDLTDQTGTGDDIIFSLDQAESGWYDADGDQFFNADGVQTISAPSNSFEVGVGGEINTDAGQSPGLYEGTVTLSVEYL